MRGPLCPYMRQQLFRRFVFRILGDELAGKGLLKYALPQGLDLLEALIDRFLDLVGT